MWSDGLEHPQGPSRAVVTAAVFLGRLQPWLHLADEVAGIEFAPQGLLDVRQGLVAAAPAERDGLDLQHPPVRRLEFEDGELSRSVR
jgi:hypothetical protein